MNETRKKEIEGVLYEIIPDCVVTFDKNNQLENCNKKFLDVVEFSKEDLIGKKAYDLMIKEGREEGMASLQRVINGKQTIGFELNLQKKNGGIFHSIWNAIPMFDEKYEWKSCDKNILKIRIESNKISLNSTNNETKIDDDVFYGILDEYNRLKKIKT